MNHAINTKFEVNGREYRVLREFDGEIITLKIPGRGTPSASLYFSENKLIEAAYRKAENKNNWHFIKWTEKELTDCFGSENEPVEAMEIALEHGFAVQCNNDWLNPGEASQYEWAIDCLSDDLSSFHKFTKISDAVEFAESYSGHGSGSANEALADELLSYKFIEFEENDDENA